VTSAQRRCFLISPIGEEGSEVRQHADDVFDFIVKPAMDKFGIAVIRSDRLHEPGSISEQMFREIAEDDLCIAVLTGANPNVYYELAVAHALARPVIILLEKGQFLPFDIKDLRCVYYDLNHRALQEHVYVDEIAAHVENLEGVDWCVPGPLGQVTPPRKDLELLERADDLGRDEHWLALLATTQRHFDLMGVSLWSWFRTEGFEELLASKAEDGCRIRIMLADPRNPSFEHLSALELDPGERQRTAEAIGDALMRLRPFEERWPAFEVRQLRRGIPHYQLNRTDNVAIAIPYWHTLSPTSAPTFRCVASSPVYGLLVQDFQAVWGLNPPEPAPQG
jgi:hypothetical protein